MVFVKNVDNPEVGLLGLGNIGIKALNIYMERHNAVLQDIVDENFNELRVLFVCCENQNTEAGIDDVLRIAKSKAVFTILIGGTKNALQCDSTIDYESSKKLFASDTEAYLALVEAVYDMIYAPGMINIDLLDLTSITESTDALHFYTNKVKFCGEAEREQAIYTLMNEFKEFVQNQDGKLITNAVFDILGSGDMSLIDVNDVCSYVEVVSKQDANLVFCAHMDMYAKESFIGINIFYR